MKRTASLSRSTEKARAWLRAPRKPIPRESARRKAQRPTRAAVVAAVRERDGVCRFPHGEVLGVECVGPLDCHERIPRSAWPGGHLVASNCLLLARSCHDWTGTHQTEAHALGLHGFSWERPPGSAP